MSSEPPYCRGRIAAAAEASLRPRRGGRVPPPPSRGPVVVAPGAASSLRRGARRGAGQVPPPLREEEREVTQDKRGARSPSAGAPREPLPAGRRRGRERPPAAPRPTPGGPEEKTDAEPSRVVMQWSLQDGLLLNWSFLRLTNAGTSSCISGL